MSAIDILEFVSCVRRHHLTASRLIAVVDNANNAPKDTNWPQWKAKYAGRSPLFADIIEYFRASAFEQPKGSKIIHNLIDQKDRKYHWPPLHWAAFSGRLDEMRILVECGADPLLLSNLDANILHSAVESKLDRGLIGALKIWKQCSDRLNINHLNRWGEAPLHIAAFCSAASVKRLLEAGADPDVREENGQVPLHFAGLSERRSDRREIVTLLCNADSKMHINTEDFDGRPPIFDFLDDPECITVLVQHGARLDPMDKDGKTVFSHACAHGESETLATLLRLAEQRAEWSAVAATDDAGNTPLMEALASSEVECAMMLLKCEDVGEPSREDGWAPVHFAAQLGDVDLLESVFTHQSFERAAKTKDGKRANVVAMESGHWNGRVKELIRKHDYLDWS